MHVFAKSMLLHLACDLKNDRTKNIAPFRKHIYFVRNLRCSRLQRELTFMDQQEMEFNIHVIISFDKKEDVII